MSKLDKKDKRILYEIDLNARLGTSALAKRVGLSQEGTFYRLGRLEKKGIVDGYITLLNFAKLGYTGYGVYARFQNVTKEKKAQIIEELKQNSNIYWIAEFGGRYDIAFAIMAKDIIHFNGIFSEISNKFNEYLKDFTVAIRVELVQYPRMYLTDSKDISLKSPRFGKYIGEEELSEIDEGILKIMAENARLSVLEVAKRVNKPASTVSLHLKKLENKGIVQGYSAKINCQEFGYQSYQLFLNTQNLTKEKRKKLFSYCQTHPNIIFCIETVGKWNFEIIYEIEEQKRLQELVIELRTLFSDIITDVESIVLYDHYVKYNQYPIKH